MTIYTHNNNKTDEKKKIRRNLFKWTKAQFIKYKFIFQQKRLSTEFNYSTFSPVAFRHLYTIICRKMNFK